MTKFDKTHLSISSGLRTGMIHRDYIAHCFRWEFAAKFSRYRSEPFPKNPTILDIGCGKDLPYYSVLCGNSHGNKPTHYYGVDLNKVALPENRKSSPIPSTLFSETNFLDLTEEQVPGVTQITSFEVLEHCPAAAVRPILKHALKLAPEATFLLSTPVWNRKYAARNHCNEMTRDAFGYLLEEVGFAIERNYGTFGDQAPILDALDGEAKKLAKKLFEYHHKEVVANMFAPLYPELARNNFWVLTKADDSYTRKFTSPGTEPWASGNDWRELLNDKTI